MSRSKVNDALTTFTCSMPWSMWLVMLHFSVWKISACTVPVTWTGWGRDPTPRGAGGAPQTDTLLYHLHDLCAQAPEVPAPALCQAQGYLRGDGRWGKQGRISRTHRSIQSIYNRAERFGEIIELRFFLFIFLQRVRLYRKTIKNNIALYYVWKPNLHSNIK